MSTVRLIGCHRLYWILLPILLSACARTTELPHWFEAIHRMPLRTMLVDGHRIAYLDAGQGPPIILVHGLGGSLWQWEYQQEALARSHRLITLDFLGAGLSDKPDIDYTPTQLLDFFERFMDAMQIPRASLVGNSLGAGIAIGMALARPERVDRLVLISGFPDHVEQKLTSPLIRQALHPWAPIWLINLGSYLSGRQVTRKVLLEMIHNEDLITPAVFERSHRNRKRPGMLKPLLKTTKNLSLWENGFAKRLGEIRQPTLIVWGQEDQVFPVAVGHALHESIPGSRFALVPDAGHIPMWEQPDHVNPLILQFLHP